MNKIILLIIKYSLIILFLYTFFHKVFDFTGFEESLLKSALISQYTDYIKYSLPLLEIMVIMLLIFNRTLLYGLYLSLLLLLLFTFYLISLNDFSFYQGCSCGGIFYKTSYLQHIIINILFIILSITGIFLHEKNPKIRKLKN